MKGIVGGVGIAALPSNSLAYGLIAKSDHEPIQSRQVLGFHGMIESPPSGLLFAGNGERCYKPNIMRFLQHDDHEMSPFGMGGVNGYAFVQLDPINLRDPTGNFAVLSFVIGMITGAIAGAAISAISEGIRVAAEGDSYDWKRVVTGAVVGGISGGFGAASIGAKKVTKIGLAVADVVTSGATEFAIDVGTGSSVKSAGTSAGIGAMVGLLTLGVGTITGEAMQSMRNSRVKLLSIKQNGLGGNGSKAAGKKWAKEAHRAHNNPGADYGGLSVLEVMTGQTDIVDNLTRHLDDRSVGRLRATSRTMSANLDLDYKSRLKETVKNTTSEIERLSIEHARTATLFHRHIDTRRNWLKMTDIYLERASHLRKRHLALTTLDKKYNADYEQMLGRHPFTINRR